MEWTIQRSLEGALSIRLSDGFEGLGLWLELQLELQPQFCSSLFSQLQLLTPQDSLQLEAHGMRFTATVDEISLEADEDGAELELEFDLHALEQSISCGYDDFLALLRSIEQFA